MNNGEWGWRALRLMSRRSSHFFISGNNPIAKLPNYLAQMLEKMAKVILLTYRSETSTFLQDMPSLVKPEIEVSENGSNNDNGVNGEAEVEGEAEAGDNETVVKVTDEQV